MTDSTAANTTATYTMFLDQSAHLDWDWIRTFAQDYWYYTDGEGVNTLIAAGIAIAASAGTQPYTYTVCEMGFFRRFLEENPQQIAAIQQLGQRFALIGGGVTSPDCLVCSGEGFIRNYLIGRSWVAGALQTVAAPHAWLPDDFGQGPELPVLLQALGFKGMAFSRLPGTSSFPNDALKNDMLRNGFDFFWQASDGSTVFAHYLVDSYALGDAIRNQGVGAISTFLGDYNMSGSPVPPYSAAQTPNLYVPIDDDFSMPLTNLLRVIAQWNRNPAQPGVTIVSGTFDQFYRAVMQNPAIRTLRYNGTPYWTGYYASRPVLKILHHAAVRDLQAAEVLGLLTQPGDASLNSMLPTGFWSRVDQTWLDFAPSTHHDYITGTAPDSVYASDQLPLLRGAAASARALRGIALNALGGMVPPGNIVAANTLGFARSGIAEVADVQPNATSFSWPDGSVTQTQTSAEGGMLVPVTVASFGYVVGSSGGGGQPPANAASISPDSTGADSFTLSNGLVSATIGANAGWGLTRVSGAGGTNILGTEAGNTIGFYDDTANGGLYQFSNETAGDAMPRIADVQVTATGPGLGAVVLETGPLRVRVRTVVLYTFSLQGQQQQTRFECEYALYAGEPFIRITTRGAAPAGTAVMARFTFAKAVGSIDHGTGYHWTQVQPAAGYWPAPVFRATHDFVLPLDDRDTLQAAVYHSAMPAWAIDSDGALIGCLLRNADGGDHGASGSDPASHTQHYALRVPDGLGGAATGQPLREACAFHTPLLAIIAPGSDTGWKPLSTYQGMLSSPTGSLASLPAESSAILTTAKLGTYDPGALILRLYQPTNAPLSATVTTASAASAVTLVTATEEPWEGGGEVTADGIAVTVDMTASIATIALTGLGRPA